MAIVGNTYTRYDAIGLREELSDNIYNISPTDTPFVSGAGKGRVRQTLFEWQTDVLGSVDTSNAQLEGDDITAYPAVVATKRVGNYAQISRKLLVISGTLETVNKAGRRSELAYQLAMRGAEIKRDMEAIALENIGGAAGATNSARKTAGLGAWLQSNVDKAGTGANPTYTSGVPGAARTDGTQRAFTETILKSVVQSMWTSGARVEGSTIMVGPVNKQKLSAFQGVVTRNYNIANAPARPTAVIAAVDVYVSDFGTLRVVPNRFQRERDAWIIDFNMVSIQHLRPFRTERLAKTGDADKRMLLVEWGLRVNNEAGLGLAADLTTT